MPYQVDIIWLFISFRPHLLSQWFKIKESTYNLRADFDVRGNTSSPNNSVALLKYDSGADWQVLLMILSKFSWSYSMVGTEDQDHRSAFTSKVQKEVSNKVVSRRRAGVDGVIRGLHRRQHFISAHHLSSSTETSVLIPRMWDINSSRKLMVWRWTHDWENRTKIEIIRRKIKTSAVTYIIQVYLHSQLLTAAVHLKSASQQTRANRPFLQDAISKAHFLLFLQLIYLVKNKSMQC